MQTPLEHGMTEPTERLAVGPAEPELERGQEPAGTVHAPIVGNDAAEREIRRPTLTSRLR